ncbi:MAG TPA: AAC(3) family N-acetyltransferase [Burkholderiales bacterium]|nr:AAC(3) family N-acetyltransferase [Burkholderiales bacterium]
MNPRDELAALGVRRGGVLLVHCAFSKVAPLEGGLDGLIAALAAAVGPAGTLVMPSMADDDESPFDRTTMPCRHVGALADRFWRTPGVLRSDSPHAFAARGPQAERVTQPHPVDVPHGTDSPPGRVLELDGQVLLLGVGHDANTTVHVAEHIAGVRYRQPKHATVLENGRPKRYEYGETDHCCENFALLDDWLGDKQRRGTVGHAEARLARSRDIVAAALARLRENETVFLHPAGSCGECDLAKSGIDGAQGKFTHGASIGRRG